MIERVLIAEDHESANISVRKTLEDMGISGPDYVYYCDDALASIQKARDLNQPYDLLITDLYFEDDFRDQKLPDGEALIIAAREAQPDLKVLVFSAENKPAIIEKLFNRENIDGFVRKARNDSKELKIAIQAIAANQRYFPRQMILHVKQTNAHDFTKYDITIINLLAKGIRQKDIPAWLKKNEIKPSGLSSVEKRLNLIREELNFTSNEQLIAYCKDMGIT